MPYSFLRFSLTALFLLNVALSFGQGIPINEWRCHLSYMDGQVLAEAKEKVYCATNSGLFYVDTDEYLLHTLCKVDGYADIFAKTLYYSNEHDLLFIGYQSGNIDLVKGELITNRPEFMNSVMPGIKEINSFYVNGNICYIATSL